MPTYTFRNKNTGEVFDKFMKVNERDAYLAEHSEIEKVLTAPGISYDNQSLSGQQPDQGFKDVLRNIHDKAIGGKYLKSKYI